MSKEIQFRRSTAVLTLVAASLGGGLIAALAVMSHGGNPPVMVRAQAAQNPSTGAAKAALQGSYADVLEKVTPAVVNISSTRLVKAAERGGSNPFLSDPFFRQFFGDPEDGQGQGSGRSRRRSRPQREGSLGSGIIINPAGYILTNNHVVDKATDVRVTLLDKREFTAKIVGTDPQTDVAVLKIEAKDLPTLQIGDSDNARVGDLCFAIGNPFGVGQTVTMGIVSAKGRSNLRDNELSLANFIQTDAAINPGNSGGALVNAHGELIGINTMIIAGNAGPFGGGAGNVGIGFAVPSAMARQVMDQIIKTGKVSRGYLGVSLEGLTPELASQFGLKKDEGALVADVTPDGPGARAGLKAGDIITAIDGKPILDSTDLTMRVIQHAPGASVSLDVLRGGNPTKVNVKLGERPQGLEQARRGRSDNGVENGDEDAGPTSVGLQIETLTAETARQLNLPPSTKGVVVDDVEEGSPAAESGLGRGDVIQQAARQPVTSAEQLKRILNENRGKKVLLMVNRDGRTAFLVLDTSGK